MFDVVNVLKVKKIGETDGDYVEQCDKAYPELEGYAVFLYRKLRFWSS